jgi:DNA-binding MarR family transcriptional regulator
MYFSSNALARKMEKLANGSWEKTNLSPSHAYLLLLVIDEPGIQPGKLSDELQLQPSTISRLIQKLEEKKLLVRITEGKTVNVYPTQKGKKMLPLLKKCVTHFSEACSVVLGKAESSKLVVSMNKISDMLKG